MYKLYISFSDKEEAKQTLQKELTGENWKEAFLIHQDGYMLNLNWDKDILEFMSMFFPEGCFCDSNEGEELLRQYIAENIEEISEWLVSKGRIKQERIIRYNHNVGYILERKKKVYDTDRVRLILRKDMKGNTKYGIYVARFEPYCGVDIQE